MCYQSFQRQNAISQWKKALGTRGPLNSTMMLQRATVFHFSTMGREGMTTVLTQRSAVCRPAPTDTRSSTPPEVQYVSCQKTRERAWPCF
ncbi:hypothetical protein Z043_114293 [Scleropages formosus]|uniref:Uncharacterized protein n=1 Tax=Scleropages formosus TaxID=113540 RepID=A0A0P7UZB5_SCLFO|nr:hypothetical protein Z043_114293 [Scleropages formosus]